MAPTGPQIPENHAMVAAGGRQPEAIRRDLDAVDAINMSTQLTQQLA